MCVCVCVCVLPGERYPGQSSVLPNVNFREEDMTAAAPFVHNSVIVCLHGCNEVNEMAIQMALSSNSSGYVVMVPCTM